MGDDSPEITVTTNQRRRSFCVFVFLAPFLSLSFSVVLFAAIVGLSSTSSPISFSSKCKIVSSDVDLRSSKVCELGILNYKAKNVFYPSERKKYRCHYDYYWASIFKVEYMDHSGHLRQASAESPNEALPLDCRPDFGAAWLTKDRFKVNGTYDCWYTLGISKVNLYYNRFFNCQVKEPSSVEMLRRYLILFAKMLQPTSISQRRARQWKWGAVTGLLTGFSTSLLSITLARLIQTKSCLSRKSLRLWPQSVYTVHLKRAFFFVAYFSCIGWLAFQYVKRLGLPEVFSVPF